MKRLFYKIKSWWMKNVRGKKLTTEESPTILENIFNYLHDSDKHLQEVFDQRSRIVDFLADREKAYLSYLCNIIDTHFDGEIEISTDHEKYVWSLGETIVDDETRKLWVAKKVEIPSE